MAAHWQSTKNQSSSKQQWSALCLQGVDYGLAATLLAAPLVFGGRHDVGRLVYAVIVAVTTLAWIAHQILGGKTFRSAKLAHGLLLAAIGLVTLQLVPLPHSVWQTLCPNASSLLPFWTAGSEASLGLWQTLSLTPSSTRQGLAVLVCHALLFFVTAQRIGKREDVDRLLMLVALAATGMSLLALLQHMASNGKLLWIYAHPTRDVGDHVQGAFTNKNHFAHFVVLGIAPLLYWLQKRLATSGELANGKKPLRSFSPEASKTSPLIGFLFVAAAICFLAVLLSLSRGGFLALMSVLAVIGLLKFKQGTLGWNHLSIAAIAVFGILALLSVRGFDSIAGRLDSLAAGSIDEVDSQTGRRAIWKANAAAIAGSPVVGYGAGSHREIYRVYFSDICRTEFTHAECGYLQVLTENGLLGGLLLLGIAGALIVWCLRGVGTATGEDALRWEALAPCVVASLTHSVVDFVWFIPACMSLTVVLAACIMRLFQLQTEPATTESSGRKRKQPAPMLSARLLGGIPSMAVVLLAVGSVALLSGPGRGGVAWDNYRKLANQGRHAYSQQLASKEEAEAAYQTNALYITESMITQLERVLRHDPSNARAHLRLAGRYIQRFELMQFEASNSMSLASISEAARASNFKNRAETVAWLERAFGQRSRDLSLAHDHAVRAVELCPLQGEGYLFLWHLCFLEPPQRRDVNAWIAQAQKVRPYEGEILYEAGRNTLLSGNVEECFTLWKEAVKRTGTHRGRIVELVAGRLPAEEFLSRIEPGWEMLAALRVKYEEYGATEDLITLAQYISQAAEQRDANPHEPIARKAYAWREAGEVYRVLGEHERSIACAKRACELKPHDFSTRFSLANALVAAEDYEAADSHVRWCLARRPDIRLLEQWLVEGARRKHMPRRLSASVGRTLLATPSRSYDVIPASGDYELTETESSDSHGWPTPSEPPVRTAIAPSFGNPQPASLVR